MDDTAVNRRLATATIVFQHEATARLRAVFGELLQTSDTSLDGDLGVVQPGLFDITTRDCRKP